jgi:hypothetical protein
MRNSESGVAMERKDQSKKKKRVEKRFRKGWWVLKEKN